MPNQLIPNYWPYGKMGLGQWSQFGESSFVLMTPQLERLWPFKEQEKGEGKDMMPRIMKLLEQIRVCVN